MTLLATLAEVGRIFARRVESKARQMKVPKDMSFSVTSPVQREGTASVEIHVKHPAVAAFEYGSGIHATKGSAGTYVIRPKNKDYLAFFWDKVDENSKTGAKFRGISKTTGKAIFTYVDHPGVAPRPFIKPTIIETRAEFRKLLGKGFKAEVLQGVNKVEVIEVK